VQLEATARVRAGKVDGHFGTESAVAHIVVEITDRMSAQRRPLPRPGRSKRRGARSQFIEGDSSVRPQLPVPRSLAIRTAAKHGS
jgi:hypothetical protein